MAKIDNIPLSVKEAFQKPIKNAYVVHREHSKPLEGSKSIKLSKEQREELKARRESLRELDSLSSIAHKPTKPFRADVKTLVEVIPKLSKRGCMDYINRHTLVHINPSDMRKMHKGDIKELAKTVLHVK